MALVSVTEAARLVRRGRATLYRDIEKGRLSKTVSASGETAIDTSELVRTYGQLHLGETAGDVRKKVETSTVADFAERLDSWGQRETVSKTSDETYGDSARTQILEERIRSLERIIALEADLRRVKDEVTEQLKSRLVDKDLVIRSLEGKVMLLEYSRPLAAAEEAQPRRSLWSRLMGAKQK